MTTDRTYTAEQLLQIPPAVEAEVTLVTGERFIGLFDGAFRIDATGEVTGAQFITDSVFRPRFVEKSEIAKVIA